MIKVLVQVKDNSDDGGVVCIQINGFQGKGGS